MHVCTYACMHVCKNRASMQVCKYASMHVCKYASMYVCMYACMQVCKSARMQVCKYASASMQVWKRVQVCEYYAICKYASMQVIPQSICCPTVCLLHLRITCHSSVGAIRSWSRSIVCVVRSWPHLACVASRAQASK